MKSKNTRAETKATTTAKMFFSGELPVPRSTMVVVNLDDDEDDSCGVDVSTVAGMCLPLHVLQKTLKRSWSRSSTRNRYPCYRSRDSSSPSLDFHFPLAIPQCCTERQKKRLRACVCHTATSKNPMDLVVLPCRWSRRAKDAPDRNHGKKLMRPMNRMPPEPRRNNVTISPQCHVARN